MSKSAGELRPRYATKRRGAALVLVSTFFGAPATAADVSPELVQPPVCSQATASQGALPGICTVTPADSQNRVKVNLMAKTTPIEVGGYWVVTDNYNDSYLAPVVEAMPGDTVAARIENRLDPRPQQHGMAHAEADKNPTNLHYFHGGIVSPKNAARPAEPETGNGDNIYVEVKAGANFEYDVQIPGEDALDARVFERNGFIAHPAGLNWYHSHRHGISSAQVTGGLSGLLSVGDAKTNVAAACEQSPSDPNKCTNDVDQDTKVLKDRTDVRYALLRDISLNDIKALPEDATGADATWAFDDQDFPRNRKCAVFKHEGGQLQEHPEPKFRKGFCQSDEKSAWLFTVNGQRFPTITVEENCNLLLRL
jgi:FtsP/CotA-like multicopper oxidase with cupredoxin domain